MHHHLVPALLCVIAGAVSAADFNRADECVSPDGALKAEVGTDAAGHLAWRVVWNGAEVIGASKAGVLIGDADSGAGATVGAAVRRTIDQRFAYRGPFTEMREHCQVAEIPVTAGGKTWTLEVRVFDQGAAYRCRIPSQGKVHINGEAAEWMLPAGAICYANPVTTQYEGIHVRAAVEQLDVQKLKKQGIAMPTTVELPKGGYAVVTEAQFMGWSGMTLEATGTNRLATSFRDDPKGWDMEGDLTTPWRVVIVAKDLNALVHQPVVNALCPPPDATLFPEGIRTPWLKPGRCLWQWWAYNDPGTHWSTQKGFVDKAAALKCEYYLVDEGWEHSRQEWFPKGEPLKAWDRLKELCDYAKAKGVGIWVWRGWHHHEKKEWPGLETHEKRVDFFRRCKEVGVAGAKIDFMDNESHDRLEFYQDCLKVAAEHQIMVNFHGANKPAGEIRTWPNEMTREGIFGLEQNKWTTVPPSHYATLPFTRLVAGHGDFTPTTFQLKFMKGTTAAQQLASAMVLTTPMLCWADKPDIYLESPAVDIIRSMPVVWDETIVLAPSRIGELAAFARRHGDEWWVAAVNGGDARSVALPMDFLGAGTWKAERYADGAKPEEMTVTKDVALSAAAPHQVDLAAGGGVTLRIRK